MINYYWIFSNDDNEFNSFVNCGKTFDIFRGIEKKHAINQELRFSAIVRKFSNDK